jgi:hypothetical protein
MKVTIRTVEFTCDICQAETATTSGNSPTGWKEFNQLIIAGLSQSKRKIHVGPTCVASSDPQILESIRDLALREG